MTRQINKVNILQIAIAFMRLECILLSNFCIIMFWLITFIFFFDLLHTNKNIQMPCTKIAPLHLWWLMQSINVVLAILIQSFCNHNSCCWHWLSQRGDLVVPRVRLTTYGKCSFAFATPTTWNMLPVQLRDNELSLESFKRGLKSHLLSKHC
jgi:hypothetical protein